MERATRRHSVLIPLAGAALLMMLGPSVARAQIVPIGPFTGQETEYFEDGYSGPDTCVPGGVFNNNATLCTTQGAGAIVTGGLEWACIAWAYEG